ncbi:metallophosphoesterase [Roseobacter litoralis]|uniref:Calcineurin-like phosphoesterase n=1 Tax=Roseobacter litoralis (strain ATCC 49566 / DSM 6996 / JCM 21268 / NBRC 15278 / OCh 149) TaxID=391595 RepID=F7ZDJ6_ROSLO|nr:metallophosphoesterase [Roseobacter litoralis]AEI94598.1 putative calcineurin-like phosphoesterase [Roseobacter litoralis Och 149]
MLIAHISDFHVFAKAPETSVVRADAADAARKVVADVAGFAPRIDAVMFTGDLTDGGSAEDYALLQDILSPIDVPVFVVPGNHDARPGLRAAFGDTLLFGAGPFLNYQARVGEIRILALDTLWDGHVAGRLDSAQLDWFAARLGERHDGLTLILMHHPAFPSQMAALDAMTLQEGRDGFEQLIAAYVGPLRILAGHIHRPFQTLWHGAFCAVSGGPAFQHELALGTDTTEPGIVREPYAYFIHRMTGPTSVSIHTRYVEL